MYCLLGLGNPGEQYARSRHNLGYRVVEELARRHQIRLRGRFYARMGQGRIAGQPVTLAQPLTFMNNSGYAAQRLLQRYRRRLEGETVWTNELYVTLVYRPLGSRNIRLLLKNYRLSDDIAFRFSSRQWSEWPLTAEKFAQWVNQVNGNGYVVNLFMDYETLGEHQWRETGIFDFLRALPGEILRHPDFCFRTPAEAAEAHEAAGDIDCPDFISWADEERDTTAWLGNAMQQDAARKLYHLETAVRRCKDEALFRTWRMLQTSDHFYYMCTKWFSDGDVHRYFNPYESPYEAYINYMNILDDFSQSLKKTNKGEKR